MQTELVDAGTPVELQRWGCYVDEIDDDSVYLMMADETVDQGDAREIGTFPKHLLEHLEPRRGQYVTVRVMSDERIVIENTHISDEARAAGRAKVDELLALLVQLRREDDDPAGTATD